MPDLSAPEPARVLVADDQSAILDALSCSSPTRASTSRPRARRSSWSRAAEARDFDVVLMDLNYARDTTSGREGLDLLPRLQAIDARCRWSS